MIRVLESELFGWKSAFKTELNDVGHLERMGCEEHNNSIL